MTADELITEIKRCWADVAYPGDDDLTVHPLGLDEAFYQGLVGKAWGELAPAFLDYHADCIGVLTPNGFLYFLPAFLVSDLTRGGDTPIDTWLLAALQGCCGGHSAIKDVSGREWFNSRMSALTAEQRACLTAYVRLKDTGSRST